LGWCDVVTEAKSDLIGRISQLRLFFDLCSVGSFVFPVPKKVHRQHSPSRASACLPRARFAHFYEVVLLLTLEFLEQTRRPYFEPHRGDAKFGPSATSSWFLPPVLRGTTQDRQYCSLATSGATPTTNVDARQHHQRQPTTNTATQQRQIMTKWARGGDAVVLVVAVVVVAVLVVVLVIVAVVVACSFVDWRNRRHPSRVDDRGCPDNSSCSFYHQIKIQPNYPIFPCSR
jgi:hypothetical protein